MTKVNADTNGYVEDFDFIVKTVERVHPCLYLTSTETQLETQRALSHKAIGHCRSVGEFWNIAQSYIAMIGDGHTCLRPLTQADSRRAGCITTLVDGQVVISKVIEPDSCPTIDVGDVILGINGRDVEERLAHLLWQEPCAD